MYQPCPLCGADMILSTIAGGWECSEDKCDGFAYDPCEVEHNEETDAQYTQRTDFRQRLMSIGNSEILALEEMRRCRNVACCSKEWVPEHEYRSRLASEGYKPVTRYAPWSGWRDMDRRGQIHSVGLMSYRTIQRSIELVEEYAQAGILAVLFTPESKQFRR